MEHLIVSRECGPQFFNDLIKEGYTLDDNEKKGKLKESDNSSVARSIIRDIEHQIDEGHNYDNFMDEDDLEDYIWSEVDFNMAGASEGQKEHIAQLIFDELDEDGYLDKLNESAKKPEAKRIKENILVTPGKQTTRGKGPQQGLIVDGMRLNESKQNIRESRICEANKNYPLLKDIFGKRHIRESYDNIVDDLVSELQDDLIDMSANDIYSYVFDTLPKDKYSLIIITDELIAVRDNMRINNSLPVMDDSDWV